MFLLSHFVETRRRKQHIPGEGKEFPDGSTRILNFHREECRLILREKSSFSASTKSTQQILLKLLSIRIAKILIINVCFFISSFIPVILNQRKGEKEKKK